MHRVIEEIVASNEWRDREFAKFKVNPAGVDQELWGRMCIPMIYAHWEGYVVSALKLLIDHLNSLGLTANNLPTKLVVVSLGDTYKSLSGKQSFGQRIDFTDKFRALICEAVKFQKKIDTKANLKSTVLEEICHMYGLEYEKFSFVIADIDRLVNIRNSIAHGENSFLPSVENISKYISTVGTAIDIFREEIERFLTEEAYLLRRSASEEC